MELQFAGIPEKFWRLTWVELNRWVEEVEAGKADKFRRFLLPELFPKLIEPVTVSTVTTILMVVLQAERSSRETAAGRVDVRYTVSPASGYERALAEWQDKHLGTDLEDFRCPS